MQAVLSVENMRESDRLAASGGVTEAELMYRAGKAVYNSVKWRFPVAVVCGTGNNAGDGYVLASLLKDCGECKLFLAAERFSRDGKFYFDACIKKGVPYEVISDKTDFSGYATIADCLLGTGFAGPLKPSYRSIIDKINSVNAYKVCIDINSGLNGDSGLGECAVLSDLTVSVGGFKPGHFLNKAKDCIKKKINVDIGIKPAYRAYNLLEACDLKDVFAKRKEFSNKGSYGYIALIGGSKRYSGAVKLANISLSAMRAGAGVVKLAVPDTICGAIAPLLLESTLFPLSTEGGELICVKEQINELISNVETVVFGMGAGTSDGAKDILYHILSTFSGTLVIDADGLNILSAFDKNAVKSTKAKLVLTPHIKEFSRLCGKRIEEIQSSPISSAQAFAAEMRCVLLLKGTSTVITDGLDTYISDRGCAGMATAGSGDVLSGIAGALCGYYKNDLLKATAAAAYLNGVAGEIACCKAGDISMIASDTVRAIPAAIKKIRRSFN